jgi:hypothetical protein
VKDHESYDILPSSARLDVLACRYVACRWDQYLTGFLRLADFDLLNPLDSLGLLDALELLEYWVRLMRWIRSITVSPRCIRPPNPRAFRTYALQADIRSVGILRRFCA